MPARQAAPCLKCSEMIEISEAAFVIDIRLRVVGIAGIAESARSSQASVSCCVTCADLIGRGDEPSARSRPLDHVVYELVQGLITDDPMYAFLSWIEFRKARGLQAPTLSDPKTLRVWNEFRKTLALPPVLNAPDGEEKALVRAAS